MIKINCTGCRRTYSYDNSKIPDGKTIEIPCPSCKTALIISSDEKKTDSLNIEGEKLFKKIIKESKALPPMPKIMAKATEILSDEKAGFKEVGDVLETDQAMATRVLKLANSAYYGLSVPVESVQKASALLGFQTLIELITVVSTSRMMDKSLKGYGINSAEMWEHSLTVANAAKLIAEKKHPDLGGNAFNAGLIHDSGMIILDEYIAKNKEIFTQLTASGHTIHHAEKKILGFNHAEIASEFFRKWNLPPAQTHAIKFHHHPDESGGDTLSMILHVADYSAMIDKPEKNYRLNENALNLLEINHDDIDDINAEAKKIVAEVILRFSS